MAEVLQLQGAVGVLSRPCHVDVAGDAAIVVVVEREVKLRLKSCSSRSTAPTASAGLTGVRGDARRSFHHELCVLMIKVVLFLDPRKRLRRPRKT